MIHLLLEAGVDVKALATMKNRRSDIRHTEILRSRLLSLPGHHFSTRDRRCAYKSSGLRRVEVRCAPAAQET